MSDLVTTIEKDENWLVDERWAKVPNRVMRDPRLSWEARGLFAFLATHSSTFRVTTATLMKAGGCGKDRVQRMVRELEDAGYLIREQFKDDANRYGPSTFSLKSNPRSAPKPENPAPGNPVTEKPEPENPATGKPATENTPPYKKTNSKKTKEQEDQAALPLLDEDALSFTVSVAPRRGCRIPDDFAYTQEMADWARASCPNVDIGLETEQFVDYWMAKAGQQATKLDWRRTWQTWMRTAQQRSPRRQTTPHRVGVFTDPNTGRSIER